MQIQEKEIVNLKDALFNLIKFPDTNISATGNVFDKDGNLKIDKQTK